MANPNNPTLQNKIKTEYVTIFEAILSEKEEATVIYYMDIEQWLTNK